MTTSDELHNKASLKDCEFELTSRIFAEDATLALIEAIVPERVIHKRIAYT